MKKQDAIPFGNALVLQFESKLAKLKSMPKRQQEDLVIGFKAGVEQTLGALLHLNEIKMED